MLMRVLATCMNPSRFCKWDLGEFDQKGTVKTRWGTREEYLSACKVAQEHGLQITVDAVLNVSLIYLYLWFLALVFLD
jgi:hypothetical protein